MAYLKYIILSIALCFVLNVQGAIPETMPIKIQECREVVLQRSAANADVLKMFDETVALWHQYYKEKNGEFDLDTLLQAIQFSAVKHEGQSRKDAAATPYIIHPIGVARSLWSIGEIRSVNVLVAALLHDTLEDTETTKEELEAAFGPRVLYTVIELTDDPSVPENQKKQKQVEHAPLMSLNAQLVKLADRLYNIRDLRNITNYPPESIENYKNWGRKLLKALRGTNANLERALEKELEAK